MCTHTTFFKKKINKNLQGCAAAQVALGEALRDGSCGAERDLFKARCLFQLAAQQAKKKKVLYMCPHTTTICMYVLRCPHAAIYICALICVLMLLHICVN